MQRRNIALFLNLATVAFIALSTVASADSAHGQVIPQVANKRRAEPFVCLAGSSVSLNQGQALLEKVQSYYSSIESMQGDFHQDSYVAALDQGELSSGAMIFAKPGKMRWSYKTPRVQEVVIRDGELWMYQPDKGQVMIDSIGAVLLSALPVSFLMGLCNITKYFDLLSSCNTGAGIALTLVPH